MNSSKNEAAALMSFERSAAIIHENSKYVAGGVNSNFRIGMLPGPLVFQSADGPYLLDADGNKLIDYYGGMGAMILGHTPEAVRRAVKHQVDRGILYAGQSPLEFEAAEILCRRIPSAQRIRFGSSGSEVVQAAMRLARAATGRRIVLKFEGHYHGWFDNILWSTAPAQNAAGPEDDPVLVPASVGQDQTDATGLDVLGWNDLDRLQARLTKGDVAAVIMEPAMCNQGAIAPLPGYLEGASELCRKAGTLLIFDEVITGFRLSAGGAQARFAVTPDLSVFAKAIANGFPVSALVGRAELLDLFVTGGVLHGGTFNAQPVAMAALIATQCALSPDEFEQCAQRGLRLRNGIAEILKSKGVCAQVMGFELMFHVAFGLQSPPRNYRDLLNADKQRYVKFAYALLRRGVRVLERGAWFVSFAHNDGVIDKTLEVVSEAAEEIR